jgi:hypothetical protein
MLYAFAVSTAKRKSDQINLNDDTPSFSINREYYKYEQNKRGIIHNYDPSQTDIKQIWPPPSIRPAPIYPRLMRMPQLKNLTLVVDFEQTLVHCRHKKGILKGAIIYKGYPCFLRPHWKEFLDRARIDYELVLWSSGINMLFILR